MSCCRKLWKISIWICLFLTSAYVHADEDRQYWGVSNFKYGVGDDVTLILNPEIRFRDDISQLSFWRSRQGLIYQINDHIFIGQNYLFARKKNTAGRWSTEHGFESDVILKWVWQDLGFSNRIRLEHRDIDVETDYRYRNQFKISKNIQLFNEKVKVYAFEEGFYDEEDNAFNQNRAGLGFVKKLNEDIHLDVSWWYRTDRTGEDWQGTHIFRTNLIYHF